MASLMPNGKQSYQDNNGNPLAGGRIYTYAAGTSTPLSTYSDAAGVTPNTNPVLLNARGEANIWWGDSPYKVVVKDASDVEIYTQDDMQAPMGRADLVSSDSGKGAALVGFDGGTLADFMRSKNARVVDSIAELKALDKTKFTHAYASGYYAAGDGGGGAYWYDSADTTSADNGGTVIVATDGGRWKLILEQSITNAQFGAKNDGVTDDTAANQAAITWCVANHKDLNVTGLSRVTASLNVDRQVDGAAYDSYFRIFTTNGGGFYVDSAIAIFSSTIAYTTAPVSQLVQWDGLRFVSSDTALAAYVLDGPRFLRSSFVGCSFSKIKCMLAATYAQSIYFINCNARRWTGAFFKASPQAYDIQVIGGLYEAGGGNCFELSSPIGCKFHTQIEGMTGTALQLAGCQGVDICTYFEQNGLDFDCRTGGLTNRGVNIHGSYFANSAATYTVKWGAATGCVSAGNWHTNNMHDLQSDSIVEINDVAQTNLSNTSEQKSHSGYRQGSLPTLSIRGANSAAYSVSGFSGRYTRSGNRIDIQFVCTLTSTGSNPQDDFYIPALPFDAAIAGPLCGSVHVVGSSVNNGISPISMTSASPGSVQSSLPVIPANVAAAAWTVRGHISYEVAS